VESGWPCLQAVAYNSQLVAAIGHEVTPVDFANYQRYHNRKLLRDEYVPRPFMYAIRRPDHDPEGKPAAYLLAG
jgi:hypothetical protein